MNRSNGLSLRPRLLRRLGLLLAGLFLFTSSPASADGVSDLVRAIVSEPAPPVAAARGKGKSARVRKAPRLRKARKGPRQRAIYARRADKVSAKRGRRAAPRSRGLRLSAEQIGSGQVDVLDAGGRGGPGAGGPAIEPKAGL